MQGKETFFYSSDAMNSSPGQRAELFRMHVSLVDFVVDRMVFHVPVFLTREDLKGAAMTGLMEAANRFDPNKGFQFKTFAEHRIRGAILDEVRKMDWFSRSLREKQNRLHQVIQKLEEKMDGPPDEEDIARALNMDLDGYYRLLSEVGHLGCVSLNSSLKQSEEEESFLDLLEDTRNDNPHQSFEKRETVKIIAEQLKSLSHNERMVISLYYYEELTQKEIAEVMELTEGRISQLHSQALHKLKVRIDRSLYNV